MADPLRFARGWLRTKIARSNYILAPLRDLSIVDPLGFARGCLRTKSRNQTTASSTLNLGVGDPRGAAGNSQAHRSGCTRRLSMDEALDPHFDLCKAK